MPQSISLNSCNSYEIRIQGHLDKSWLEWLGIVGECEVGDGRFPITTLSNISTDQAGLVGLIRQLHSMGVVLLSIQHKYQDGIEES